MENNQIIKIHNFNLTVFNHLLDQSLIVSKELMIEFSDNLVRSASVSNSKSLMKIWVTPMENLIGSKMPKPINDLDADNELFPVDAKPSEKLTFETFNFYVFKGDVFKSYLNVMASETIDIEFNIKDINGKKQASSIIIFGKSISGSDLKTTFLLTTEETMSNVITDYAEVISKITPEPDMAEIILNDKQTQEIKRLVKCLHKSIVDNSSYLTFTVNSEKIVVNDKVFDVTFELDKSLYTPETLAKLETPIVFNILKTDFVMTGHLNYSIYASNNSPKIILGTTHVSALIWCLATKITDANIALNSDVDSVSNELDSINLEEYGLGGDLPF